jgi:hypothetical protein
MKKGYDIYKLLGIALFAWSVMVVASAASVGKIPQRVYHVSQCEYYYDRNTAFGIHKLNKRCGCTYYLLHEGMFVYRVLGLKVCKRHGRLFDSFRRRRT